MTTVKLTTGYTRTFSCIEAALEWLELGKNRAALLLAIIIQEEIACL